MNNILFTSFCNSQLLTSKEILHFQKTCKFHPHIILSKMANLLGNHVVPINIRLDFYVVSGVEVVCPHCHQGSQTPQDRFLVTHHSWTYTEVDAIVHVTNYRFSPLSIQPTAPWLPYLRAKSQRKARCTWPECNKVSKIPSTHRLKKYPRGYIRQPLPVEVDPQPIQAQPVIEPAPAQPQPNPN